MLVVVGAHPAWQGAYWCFICLSYMVRLIQWTDGGKAFALWARSVGIFVLKLVTEMDAQSGLNMLLKRQCVLVTALQK